MTIVKLGWGCVSTTVVSGVGCSMTIVELGWGCVLTTVVSEMGSSMTFVVWGGGCVSTTVVRGHCEAGMGLCFDHCGERSGV
jgi:hypothetical protein